MLPLADNFSEDRYGYELHVFTGLKPHAGTKSKVSFVIAGTKADTGVRLIDDGERQVRLCLIHVLIVNMYFESIECLF